MASYGTVSNITYGGGLAVSWIAFVKQTGLSPLMPGQWKKFLAFYAGAYLPAHAGSSRAAFPSAAFLCTAAGVLQLLLLIASCALWGRLLDGAKLQSFL